MLFLQLLVSLLQVDVWCIDKLVPCDLIPALSVLYLLELILLTPQGRYESSDLQDVAYFLGGKAQ
jgi:hypothetical protein